MKSTCVHPYCARKGSKLIVPPPAVAGDAANAKSLDVSNAELKGSAKASDGGSGGVSEKKSKESGSTSMNCRRTKVDLHNKKFVVIASNGVRVIIGAEY